MIREYKPQPKQIPSRAKLQSKPWWDRRELSVMFGVTTRTVESWAMVYDWRKISGMFMTGDIIEAFYPGRRLSLW